MVQNLQKALKPELLIEASDYLYSEDKIREITQPDVTDDRIFGRLTNLEMEDLLDSDKVEKCRDEMQDQDSGIILIIGEGASIIAEDMDVLIYADMARWEIQKRMRNNEVNNIGINNAGNGIEDKYKRGFFVDWRICDKLKEDQYEKFDFILDTNKKDEPKLIDKNTFDFALQETIKQPFSVVPFFDPGPWGGQWMRKVCGLDEEPENFAWCFNCVPEENSVLFEFGLGFSNLFPLLFSIAIDKMPDYANEVSGFIILAVSGGAVISPLMGFVNQNFGVVAALFVLVACILYVAYAAMYILGKEVKHQE
ncbi:MAG: hypothetical protein WD059_01920 [Balneolaceae bacterium]